MPRMSLYYNNNRYLRLFGQASSQLLPLKVSSINVLRRNDKKVFGGLYTHKVTKFC